jgi:hypothetical protein
MNDVQKISGEDFMKLFKNATAVDYAGAYMSVQEDDEQFIFLPNVDYEEPIEFDLDIIKRGVYVNRFGDCFRFDTDKCDWFGLLSTIKLAV